MNALSLYHDLKERGVILQADDERLLVDAPAGVVTEEDKNAILEVKPLLLRFLSRPVKSRQEEDDERRLLAAGWTPKERCGPLRLTIWAKPETGFYYCQEVALHRLGQRQGGEA